jgi:hypothetical protein
MKSTQMKKIKYGTYSDDENITNYKYVKSDNYRLCSYCCNKYEKTYNCYDDNKILKACVFCIKLINYKPINVYEIIAAKSDMSQFEIINKTLEIFNNTEKIPVYKEVDNNAKLISSTTSREIIKCLNKHESNFDDVKFFFTNKINRNSIIGRNFIVGDYPIENLKIEYITGDFCKLSDKQQKLLDNIRIDELEEQIKKIGDMRSRL